MAKELPPKPEENLDELIPGFVKEKQEVRSPYKFQTLEEFFDEFKPVRLKPGDEGYEHVDTAKIEESTYDVTQPKDKWGVAQRQERKISINIESSLMGISQKHWWLLPEYQSRLERGELVELINFFVETGNEEHSVNVYVFGEPLPPIYKFWLSQTISYLAQVDGGRVFNLVDGILIHNSDIEVKGVVFDERTGKTEKIPYAAQTRYSSKTIEMFGKERGLYPDVSGSRDIEFFSFFIVALIHEFGHLVHSTLEDGWQERLGWKREKVKEKVPGKLKRKKRERLVPKEGFVPPSQYSHTNPREDFAESFAFLLLEPEKLDPKKRDWLIEEVIKQKSVATGDRPKVETLILSGADMQLPQITRDTHNYGTSYKIELGEESKEVKRQKREVQKELLKLQQRLNEYLPSEDVKDIKIDTALKLRYDWWTTQEETSVIFDEITKYPFVFPIAHIIEGMVRYFEPEFIKKYFGEILKEFEKYDDKREATKEVLSLKMLRLAAILASQMDLREDLSLLGSIRFFEDRYYDKT